MSFAEIEALVGSLPMSARTRRGWWKDTAAAGAKPWSTAGWSVRSVHLLRARVVFVHQPSPQHGWSQRHPVVIAIYVAVAASLVVAVILGLIHLLATPANSATLEAAEVSSCIHDHGMSGASAGPINPSNGTYVPFEEVNQGQDIGWHIGNRTYGGGPIPVSLYESCSWPATPGADTTGYSRILVSTVPGEAQYTGVFDPTGYANVLDTSCKRMRITYTGGQMGVSFSKTVSVSAGEIIVANPKTLEPRKPIPNPRSVTSWAKSMNYYITPGETVVLHPRILSILSVSCIS